MVEGRIFDTIDRWSGFSDTCTVWLESARLLRVEYLLASYLVGRS